MFRTALNRLLVAAAVAGGLLVAAAPTSAHVDKPKDPSTHTGNIIAVLIGAVGTTPEPLTAPLGSTKGSLIDAGAVYGSDN